MALIGHETQRFVAYPISQTDKKTGLATINWIAELTQDPAAGWRKEDWNRGADRQDFAPMFADWSFDWIDIPDLISRADEIYEYPMVDRDPVSTWLDGAMVLMGDAAHATYPVGSSGASQAIIDARVLGANFLKHGVGPAALQAFESDVLPKANAITLANRGSGPDAVLQMIEDRCGGQFDRIEDVASHEELSAHAAAYKAKAGFDIAQLNAAPPILSAL